MSMDALSGDIFSILRKFTSPRMGQFDNTNAPRPMPPTAKAEADSDAARVMSDPTRYGATGSDAGTGLVPQPPTAGPPQPVARRVVPAGAPGRPVQADPRTTGAVQQPPPLPAPSSAVGRLTGGAAPPPPTDGSRATALINAPDQPGETGAVPGGGGGGEFDFISQSPLYRFMQMQQRRAYEENERQQRMDNLIGGFGRVINAATGTGGKGAPGGVKVRGDIAQDATLDYATLKDLQDRSLSAAAEAEDLRRMTKILADPKMKGITREALLTIKHNDSKKYAEIIKDYNSGESETFTDPTTGSIYSRPKHGDPSTPPKLIYESPWTERKAAIEQEKGITEIQKGRQTLIGADVDDPGVLRMIAVANGRNPDDPAVQAWVRSMSAEQKQAALAAAGGTGGGFAEERRKKLFGDGAKLGVIGEGKASIEGSIATNEALQRLRQGEGWTGAIGGNEGVRWIAKIAGDLGISTALGEGATQTEINETLARVGKAAKSKLFGTNPSDAEQKALDALTGVDQTMQRDALIFLNQRLLRQNVRTALQSQAEMESAKKDFVATPHAAAAIGTLDVPDYTEEIFPKAPDGTSERDTVYQVADVATQHADNPAAQKQLEQHRAAFDKAHGKGMFDYVLQHRPAQ